MNAYEFGWKLGREKISIDKQAILGTIGRGMASLGSKMTTHGYKALHSAAAPALRASGPWNQAIQSGRTMAQSAFRNPMKMITHPFSFAYRDAARGQAALALGRPLEQFGQFLSRF